MTEIIEELPKLSHAQRRELCQRIISLEAEQDDLAACDAAATESFILMDRMEAEDEAHARRPQK